MNKPKPDFKKKQKTGFLATIFGFGKQKPEIEQKEMISTHLGKEKIRIVDTEEFKQWKNLYIDGTAHIDNASIEDIGCSNISASVADIFTASIDLVSSSIIPDADDTYDLGSS